MNSIKVSIINKSASDIPQYESKGAAGLDLRANINEKIKLAPMERKLIKTGIFLEIPPNYEAQVRSRSGLALKNGVCVLNSPGTIDADYRGEVGVILVNLSNQDFEISPSDRIAQLVFAKIEQVNFIKSEVLSSTERGEGGFGSTGKK